MLNRPYKPDYQPSWIGNPLNHAAAGFSSSATILAANQALFIPITINVDGFLISGISWINGLTISGNVDVGLYDCSGNRLVSSGSIAQSGASALQTASLTATQLNQGSYMLAIAVSSGTSTFLQTTSTTQCLIMAGFKNQSTAFPLPNPATWVAPTVTKYPTLLFVFQGTW